MSLGEACYWDTQGNQWLLTMCEINRNHSLLTSKGKEQQEKNPHRSVSPPGGRTETEDNSTKLSSVCIAH